MAQFQNVWGKTSLAKDRDKALGCLRRMTKLETYIIYVIKDEDHQDDNHDHDVQDDQDHKENHSDNRGYKIDTMPMPITMKIQLIRVKILIYVLIRIRMTASIMPKHIAGDMDLQTTSNNDQ